MSLATRSYKEAVVVANHETRWNPPLHLYSLFRITETQQNNLPTNKFEVVPDVNIRSVTIQAI